LETDVRATADGALVVFHDARLDRLTDLTGPVAAVTWERLRRARLAGGERVPLLADVVAAWPALRLNVDLKAAGTVRPFAGRVPVVTRRLVAAVHAAGAQVHVWTVDDPARMRALLADGVDGIVTNRADLAVPLAAAAQAPGGGDEKGTV